MNIQNYDKKPIVLEAKGNGSYFYRWNIQEVAKEDTTSYNCDEVTIWSPITRSKIKKEVINHLWNKDFEQKLINKYNAVQLGIYSDDESKKIVDEYTQFLSDLKEIKEHIDLDCEELNIK